MIGLKLCFFILMIVREKIIYLFIIKVNKFFFVTEIENMFYMFLLSYRKIRGSLGEF